MVSQVKRDLAPIDPYATLHESFLSAVSDDLLFVDFFRAGTSDGFGVGSTVPEVKMSSSWPWEPKRILLIMLDNGELQQWEYSEDSSNVQLFPLCHLSVRHGKFGNVQYKQIG